VFRAGQKWPGRHRRLVPVLYETLRYSKGTTYYLMHYPFVTIATSGSGVASFVLSLAARDRHNL